MSEGQEFELKFALDPGMIGLLAAHHALQSAFEARRTVRLKSTYFDTPTGTLRKARASLRMRDEGGAFTETAKSAGRSRVDRAEFERANSSGVPDPAWLAETPLGALLADTGAELGRRFVVDVARTLLPIAFGQSEIEGAVDCGLISGGGHLAEVSELELELKNGSVEDLFELAQILARDLPLTLSLTSKSDRGYALAEGRWGKAEKRVALSLGAQATLGEAFAEAVEGCLELLCRNAALIGTGGDDEAAVHTARIALRHLQATLDLFRPALKRGRLRALQPHLSWAAHQLGAARDADVFQRQTFDKVAVRDEPQGVVAVAETMRALRRQAHDDLAAAMSSPRWRLLLIDLLAFSMEGVKRSRRDRRAAPFVTARFAEHRLALARSTRGWSKLSPEALHDIRKSAKRLRYALELFADPIAPADDRRAVEKLADTLQTLQQTLGDMHDPIAMRDRLGDVFFRQDRPHDVSEADWSRLQAAAEHIAQSHPQENHTLARAFRAAKRLRNSKAF